LTGFSIFTKLLCFLAVEALMLFAMMVVMLAPIYPLFLILQTAERLLTR
jgi:hypothetical protein